MRLLRKLKTGFVFHLGRREQRVLLSLLELYPLVPASHHRLTHEGLPSQPDESQRLLEESLAEQRKENRIQLQAMLGLPDRFRPTETGFEFNLAPAEIDWLLQVLNDIRVGSWLALGEPEQGEVPDLTEQNARHLLNMEAAGMFQSSLLHALGISESPEWTG